MQELKANNKTIIFSTHLMQQAEELCDEICLINHGQKILGGSVRDVKRNFGWRYVALDGENLDAALTGNSLVERFIRRRDYTEVTLSDGNDPQALLQQLIARGAQLTRFELVAPSLNEIFIESVKRQ